MSPDAILSKIRGLSVLVVGDICLDRWCQYEPSAAEPSRETGLPRVGVVSVETTAGAGGTVANNLVALGAGRVGVLGVVGDDGHGYELRRELARLGVDDLLVSADGVQTFTYTKLINHATGEEDLPRVDYIATSALPPAAERGILAALEKHLPSYDVVLVADQAETDQGGVVTPAVREALQRAADANPQKLFWVDSRRRIHLFRRMVLKPNRQEADAVCAELFGTPDYNALQRHTEARPLLVTNGGDGILLVDGARQQWFATRKVENPVDICGAGDSFTAGGSLALAATSDIAAAIWFGNLVAGITIMKKGTGTASPDEVRAKAAASA